MDDELRFVLEQPTHANMGNTTSDDSYVLKSEQMAGLRAFIEASLAEYFAAVHAPKMDVELQVTQSWLNYTTPGQFHHKHAHPNSFVSGVLYVQASREQDRIYFYRDGYQQIKLPTDNWNLYNSESWWFETGAGDLLIFPSSLTHMVQTVTGDQTRISLAFNTFPVGTIGDEASLTGLHLRS